MLRMYKNELEKVTKNNVSCKSYTDTDEQIY